jgi:hypothetical protein
MLHCTLNALRSPCLWLFSHLDIYTSYTRLNDDCGGVYASLQRLRGRDVVANSKMKIISLIRNNGPGGRHGGGSTYGS